MTPNETREIATYARDGYPVQLVATEAQRVVGTATYRQQTASWNVLIAGRQFEEPTEHGARIALLAGKPAIEALE